MPSCNKTSAQDFDQFASVSNHLILVICTEQTVDPELQMLRFLEAFGVQQFPVEFDVTHSSSVVRKSIVIPCAFSVFLSLLKRTPSM